MSLSRGSLRWSARVAAVGVVFAGGLAVGVSAGQPPGARNPSAGHALSPAVGAADAARSTITAFGLQNTSLGMATISYDPVARRLPVGNLGSSGQDGVEVNLGVSEGFVLGWDPLPLPAPGATLRLSATGQLEGLPPQPMGTMIIGPCMLPGCPQCVCITADYASIGSTTQRLEVYDQGRLVEVFTGHTGMAASVPEWPTGCSKGPARIGPVRTSCYRPTWPNRVAISIGGGPTVMGDELRVLAENPSAPFQSLSSVSVQAGGLGMITLTDEAVSVFRKPWRHWGAATLDPQPNSLHVANIGSSGQDGVSVDLGRSESFNAFFAPFPPTQDGAYLEASAHGSVNGVADHSLGSCRFTQTSSPIGTAYEMTVDFGPINSPLHHIVLLSGGVVVADFPDQSGPVGLMTTWPRKVGKLGGTTECFVACNDVGTQFLVGGGFFVADEIRVLAQTNDRIDYKSEFGFTASGINQFTITDATGADTPTWGFGLPNGALGQAEVVATTARTVIVSNIGSSGQDGVSIALGCGNGFLLGLGSLPTSAPSSASLRIEAEGQLEGTAFQPVGTMIIGPCVIPGCPFCVCITADYSAVGSMSQRLEVYNHGQLVAEFDGHTGLAASVPAWPSGCGKGPAFINGVRTSCYVPTWPDTIPIMIGGGPTVMGNELRVLAENPSSPYVSVRSVALTAKDIPSITLTDESVSLWELPVRALGEAHLGPQLIALEIGNLGSSGQDGVRLSLGRADAVGLYWDAIVGCWPPPACQEPPPPPPDGAYLRASFVGSHGGHPDQYLGYTQCTDAGPNLAITADYSPVGATLHRLEVYNAGMLVGVFTDHTGTDALVGEWPDGCGKGGAGTGAARVACGRWWWRHPILIDIPGLLVGVMGDELRVLAQNPSAPFNYVQEISLTASMIPGMHMTDATTAPHPPCPPDFNGDNQVGAADLALLLGSWGSGGTAQDLNGDGIVNAADLALLLGSWGPCP